MLATPGVLLVHEAGGWARRLDGSEYQAAQPSAALLVASDEHTWHMVLSGLLDDPGRQGR